MPGFGETCPNKARSGFRCPPPGIGGLHAYRFHRGGRGGSTSAGGTKAWARETAEATLRGGGLAAAWTNEAAGEPPRDAGAQRVCGPQTP